MIRWSLFLMYTLLVTYKWYRAGRTFYQIPHSHQKPHPPVLPSNNLKVREVEEARRGQGYILTQAQYQNPNPSLPQIHDLRGRPSKRSTRTITAAF